MPVERKEKKEKEGRKGTRKGKKEKRKRVDNGVESTQTFIHFFLKS